MESVLTKAPRSTLVLALGLLASIRATSAQAQAHEGARRTPRYLFVETPAPKQLPRGTYEWYPRVHLPLHTEGRALTEGNPVDVPFVIVDTSLLAKHPIADPGHAGSYSYEDEIPSEALMAGGQRRSTQIMRMVYRSRVPVGWDHRFVINANPAYREQFAPGSLPRVAYEGSPETGRFEAAQAGIIGPKLNLVADKAFVEAYPSDPDELMVVIHGFETGEFFEGARADGTRIPTRPVELAAMIKAEIRRQGLSRTVPIRLVSCSAGALSPGDPAGMAQQLADALVDEENPAGNEVIAPTGVAHLLYDKIARARPPELIVYPALVLPQRSTTPEEDRDRRLLGRYRTFIGRSAHRAGSPGPAVVAHGATPMHPAQGGHANASSRSDGDVAQSGRGSRHALGTVLHEGAVGASMLRTTAPRAASRLRTARQRPVSSRAARGGY